MCNLNTDEIQGGQVGDEGLKTISIPDDLQPEWTVESDFISAIRDDIPVSPTFYAGLSWIEIYGIH